MAKKKPAPPAAEEEAAPVDPMAALTPKQARFVQEYLIDLNGTQAAIRAGYSKDTAKQIADENLSKPDLAAALAPLISARAVKTGVKAENVLIGLVQLASANMQDFQQVLYEGDLSLVSREQAAAVQEMTVETYMEGKGPSAERVRRVKLKLAPKQPAFDSIAKHLGMYIERKAIVLGGLGEIPDAQLAAAIAELATQLGVAPPAAGSQAQTRH